MNQRIQELRRASLQAINHISAERALLVTEFYEDPDTVKYSIPVQRALCLKYILTNKSLYLGDGELIVGERGPAPKATPTYPEICLHSLDDLHQLHTRPKVSFQVDAETTQKYAGRIIPFWLQRTQRNRLFDSVTPQWLAAYRSGIFTEFQEQRAPGHTVCGDKIYRLGMLELREQVQQRFRQLEREPDNERRCEQLRAMAITAEAIIDYAGRYAELLEQEAVAERDEARRDELLLMASVCRRVPANAPRTFQEALQYYWFIHLGVIIELNPWDAFNPGRLDQHLNPFYQQELAAGTLSRERATELLQAFWIKFNNHPSPPKMGVTAAESNTYTDFALINLGGLLADGSDAVNEMTYLLLDVVEEMRLLQPSSMVQISLKSPDALLQRALRIIQTGYGQPSLFNSDLIVAELVRQGKSVEDARRGGASGCVESGAFGTESYILTGYFNLNKVLELTLNDGVDPRTGEQIGITTGDPRGFKDFAQLLAAFEQQLGYFIDIKIQGNLIIEQLYAEYLPVPFLSLLIDDCITNARDYNDGGSRYNTSYIQGVGLGSITDNLASLRHHVFSERSISMTEMLTALAVDFQGFEELQKNLVYHTPKYGNDDQLTDELAQQVFQMLFNVVDGRTNYRGGQFRVNLLPTTSHVYFGSVTGAMPDGRNAGQPLSEGISPVQGADGQGPTAVLRSACAFDHTLTGGTLLNQKFAPDLFRDDIGREGVLQLVRSYFSLNGHHIQFNVVAAATLRDAQQHPEKYRDLIVRVAGYSDYFNDLGVELQNEIIARTAHERF